MPSTRTNGATTPPQARTVTTVPITTHRTPYTHNPDKTALQNAGEPRANLAPSANTPNGTTEHDWNKKHAHQSVLQQHVHFFDRDQDGILFPHDTFIGFHRLGFNLLLCILAVLIIHANFSYPTVSGVLPDPLFRIYLENIHKDKHGSDTGTYDTEGRFVPQNFENIFAKYAEEREYLTLGDVWRVMKGQRCIADPVGWGGAFFEWIATYIMLWPADGRMMKEDVRGVYDGSIFYRLAERREGGGKGL